MALWLPVPVMAQEGVVHDNILKLKIGTGYQLDSYLSTIGYTGMQYGLENEWWQAFSGERPGGYGSAAGDGSGQSHLVFFMRLAAPMAPVGHTSRHR